MTIPEDLTLLTRTRNLLLPLALVLSLSACHGSQPPPYPHAIMTPVPNRPLPALALRGPHGPFSLTSLKGHWVWIFFGYTHCPDVCPLSLSYMAGEYQKLKRPQGVKVVFVSVDPKRDGPAMLKAYTAYYQPNFIGISGTQDALAALAKPFGALYVIEKPSKPGENYEVSHTNLIFVLDPQGRYVASYAPGEKAGEMASDFNALMSASPR
jgi:protein SCO1/2